MDVVTTLPSATEIVAALGLEPVGVSHECDYPPAAAESAPSVTSSPIDADGDSSEIDQQVLAADDGGVYDVDTETLERLAPDLIVTQGMCDVCAVDEVVVADAVDTIEADPEILTTDPHTIGDVLEDIERIGPVTGREERARAVRTALEERIDRVRERTADIAADERPRVAVFDWTDPVMIAGHWTAELVDWAGGAYGLADVGERSRPREWADIRAYDPETVIVAPCGFDLAQTAANRTDLTDRPGWDELTAVQDGRVWAMDGDHYSNRPGPRLVATLEAFARIVQPDLFDDSFAIGGPGDEPGSRGVFGDETPPPSFADVSVPFDDLETRTVSGGSND